LLLVCSGATLNLALYSIMLGSQDLAVRWLLAAIFLAFIFTSLKAYAHCNARLLGLLTSIAKRVGICLSYFAAVKAAVIADLRLADDTQETIEEYKKNKN
jgi:heme/copper-type cytochrome/quinol oxidase subunit 3